MRKRFPPPELAGSSGHQRRGVRDRQLHVVDGPPPAVGAGARERRVHQEVVVGGGVEYAFLNNWSFKIEGMYYELQDTHAGGRMFFNNNILAPFLTHRTASDVEHTGFIVRGGINYRFSWTFWDLVFGRRGAY